DQDYDLVRNVLFNIKEYIIVDLYDMQRNYPHYSLVIDSELFSDTVDFINKISQYLKDQERDFSDWRYLNQHNVSNDKVNQYISSRVKMLNYISDEAANFNKTVLDKLNVYYEEYQKKYIN